MNSTALSCLRFIGVIAAGAAVPVLRANPNLLTNGDFEDAPLSDAGMLVDAASSGYFVLTGDAIPGWTIAAGHSATLHEAPLQPTIGGRYSVNLDGEAYYGTNDDMSQTFATTAGTDYLLSFDWASWNIGPGDLEVQLTDTATGQMLYDSSFAATVSTGNPTPINETGAFAGTGDIMSLRVLENPATARNDNEFLVDDFSVEATGFTGSSGTSGDLQRVGNADSIPDHPGWTAEALAAAGLLMIISGRPRRELRLAKV